MRHSPLNRFTRLLVLGLGALTACTTPSADTLARDLAAVTEMHVGLAPRWQAGEGPSAAEDRRVRELLSTPLDERGAVEVALIRSRRVQASIEHAIAAALEAHAEAAPANPVIEYLVRWPHGSGGPILDLGLSFGLLDLLRLPGRSDAADLATREASLDAAQAILDLVAEVRRAWIETAATQQLVALDADSVEAAQIAADLAERQFAAGTLPEIDHLRFRAFAAEAHASLDRTRGEAVAAAERLVRALGLHGEDLPVAVAGHLPVLSLPDTMDDDVERRAVTRRIDLERARGSVVAARLAAGLAGDTARLPDLELGASFERESDGSRSTGPSVSLVAPISPREAAFADAAEARAREAEARLFDLAVQIRSEAREAAAALQSAASTAARHRDVILPLRTAIVEQAQLHYNGMLIGVYDLLQEKREELRARRELVEALRAAWIARIDFDVALGGEPPEERGDTDPIGPAPAPVHEGPHDPTRHGGK